MASRGKTTPTKETGEDCKNKDALEKGIIRLSLEPLPAIKKSKTKLPKEKKVKDAHTGEWRRLRFDVDYWKRERFHNRLELLAKHLSEKYGRQKEGPPRSEVGKQLVLNMAIKELIKQPEIKGFKSSNERTLKIWRYEIYKIWPKENPALKIYVGRPKRIKLS